MKIIGKYHFKGVPGVYPPDPDGVMTVLYEFDNEAEMNAGGLLHDSRRTTCFMSSGKCYVGGHFETAKPKAKIIAVDFDGCLCANQFPDIGAGIYETIRYLKKEQRNGARLILWTCRRGERLTAAVNWCAEQGLFFEAVNENLPDVIEDFGGDTRKIYADVYLDDKAVNVSEIVEATRPS